MLLSADAQWNCCSGVIGGDAPVFFSLPRSSSTAVYIVGDVYVVGSLTADHRVRVSRIPKAGETILGSQIVVGAGGRVLTRPSEHRAPVRPS